MNTVILLNEKLNFNNFAFPFDAHIIAQQILTTKIISLNSIWFDLGISNFSFLTNLKIIIWALFIILHIFFFITEYLDAKDQNNKNSDWHLKKSGIDSKILRKIAHNFLIGASAYATFITIKNELQDNTNAAEIAKIAKKKEVEYNENMSKINLDLKTVTDQKAAGEFSHRLNLTRIDNSRAKLEQIQNKKSKIMEELDKLNVKWDNVNIDKDPHNIKKRLQTQLQGLNIEEKRAIDELSNDVKQGIKFSAEYSKTTEAEEIKNSALAYKDENIKESSMIFLDSKDLTEYWNKFEASNGITQLTYTLLLSNSLILSCVFGMIIYLYGNYLLERFKIEENYPKLAILIKYRRKLSKYYIVSNLLVIILVCLTNILLGLSILSLD